MQERHVEHARSPWEFFLCAVANQFKTFSEQLVFNVAELLDGIFDISEQLLIKHSTTELFSAIQDAYEQIKLVILFSIKCLEEDPDGFPEGFL